MRLLARRRISSQAAEQPAPEAAAGEAREQAEDVVSKAPSPEAEDKSEWSALWRADSESVAATGKHLESIMWSDDGAVGVRGWYY